MGRDRQLLHALEQFIAHLVDQLLGLAHRRIIRRLDRFKTVGANQVVGQRLPILVQLHARAEPKLPALFHRGGEDPETLVDFQFNLFRFATEQTPKQ